MEELYLIKGKTLRGIANAIRSQKGTEELLDPAYYEDEILSIQSGGGEGKLALVVSANQDINEGGYDITADDLKGVTEIRDYAFYGCAIKTADLRNVTKIGRDAFQDAYYLESVQFNPNGVQMDAQSFDDWSPIWTNNTDEEGFTVIAKNLCSFSGSLIDGVLNIKNGVEIIADNIDLPYDMTQVVLPEGLKVIGGNAFNYKSSLSTITFPTTIEEIKWDAFSNTGITVLDLSNAHSLKSIRRAFISMNLENVILPEGLEEVSDYAFQHSYIKEITIPSTVKSFGIYSFQSSNVENVFFNGDVNDWANIDFNDSYGNPARIADNFYIGGNLLEGAITIIPKEAEVKYDTFWNQKKITSVVIENGSNESIRIASRAFYECKGLTYVELPSNIRWIDSKAFATSSQYPNQLLPKRTYVVKSYTVPFIEEDTFLNNNIEKIIVPVGCGETYKTATNWTTVADYIEEATE